MKAVQVVGYGDFDQLQVVDIPKPFHFERT